MQDNKLIKALVLNAQLGNNSAFEQLYRMTVQAIYALIMRLTSNSSVAEKYTKKTYINAWQRISQKEENLSFANWLKKIAVKTILEESSKNKAAQNGGGINAQNLNETDMNFISSHPLDKLIGNLEFNNKLVFVLHDLENFTYEDISGILGISVKDVRALLIKSRENIIILSEE